jgi:hypothetical protein
MVQSMSSQPFQTFDGPEPRADRPDRRAVELEAGARPSLRCLVERAEAALEAAALERLNRDLAATAAALAPSARGRRGPVPPAGRSRRRRR